MVDRSTKYNYVSLAHPEKSARISPITNYTQAGEVANRITSVIQRADSTSNPFVSFGIMSLTTVVELMKICEIKPTLRNIKSQLSADISSLASLLIMAITKFGHKTLESPISTLFYRRKLTVTRLKLKAQKK